MTEVGLREMRGEDLEMATINNSFEMCCTGSRKMESN